MLGHLVHGADRCIDLVNRGGLFAAFLGNSVHQRIGGARFAEHGLQLDRRIGHQTRAALHFVRRLLDKHLYIRRG